jgi:hypothetical protein
VLATGTDALTVVVPTDQLSTVVTAALGASVVPVLAGN